MATTFYLHSTTSGAAATAPGTPPDSGAYYDLDNTSGGSGTFVTNTANGPVTPPDATTHVTKTAAGTKVTWVSYPLKRFTCSGNVIPYTYAKESNALADAARVGYFRLGRLTPSGTYTWFATGGALTTEAATTSTAYTGATITPTSTDLAIGDRLVAEFYIDDYSGASMATGYTVTYTENTGFKFSVNETVTVFSGLTTTAGSMNLGSSSAILKHAEKALTTAGGAVLTTTSLSTRRAYTIHSTTVGGLNLTTVFGHLDNLHRALTTAGAFSLTASTSAASKTVINPVSVTTSAGGLALASGSSIVNRGRRMLTIAGAFQLDSVAAIVRRGRKMLTTAGSLSLLAATANTNKGHNTLTTAGGFSLTASSFIVERGRKALTTAGTLELTSSTSVLKRGRDLHSIAGSSQLDSATSLVKRGRLLVPTSGSFSLTSSTSVATKTAMGTKNVFTTAGGFSLMAAAMTSRWAYRVIGSMGLTLSSSPSVVHVSGPGTVYTYAPPMAISLNASSAVLNWSTTNVLVRTTAGSLNLTTAIVSRGLDKSLFTYPELMRAVLTSSPAGVLWVPRKFLLTVASRAALTSTVLPLTKTNSGSGTTKSLTTIAGSCGLSASLARISPLKLENMLPGSLVLSASSAGVAVSHGSVPGGYYLTTVASSGSLTASPTSIFYSGRLLQSVASSAGLSSSGAVVSRTRRLTLLPMSAVLSSTEAHLIGHMTLHTLPGSLVLSMSIDPQRLVCDAKGRRGHGKRHPTGGTSDAQIGVARSGFGSTSDGFTTVKRNPLGDTTSE